MWGRENEKHRAGFANVDEKYHMPSTYCRSIVLLALEKMHQVDLSDRCSSRSGPTNPRRMGDADELCRSRSTMLGMTKPPSFSPFHDLYTVAKARILNPLPFH
jgi:hypothetical protein